MKSKKKIIIGVVLLLIILFSIVLFNNLIPTESNSNKSYEYEEKSSEIKNIDSEPIKAPIEKTIIKDNNIEEESNDRIKTVEEAGQKDRIEKSKLESEVQDIEENSTTEFEQQPKSQFNNNKEEDKLLKRGTVEINENEINTYYSKSNLKRIPTDRLNSIEISLKNLKKKRFVKRGNFYIEENNEEKVILAYYGNYSSLFSADGNPIIDFNIDSSTPNFVFHFPYDTYQEVLSDEESDLNQLVDLIKSNYKSIKRICIIGNTCDIGSYLYNNSLSMNRANRIATELKELEINILLIANGELNPVVDNKDEKSRSKNRRAEILIITES